MRSTLRMAAFRKRTLPVAGSRVTRSWTVVTMGRTPSRARRVVRSLTVATFFAAVREAFHRFDVKQLEPSGAADADPRGHQLVGVRRQPALDFADDLGHSRPRNFQSPGQPALTADPANPSGPRRA